MMRHILILIALLAPMPALALSCMKPTVEHSFERFAAAEEPYIIVHGRVTFDTKLLPNGMSGDRKPPRMTQIPAELAGKSMGKKGFDLPFDQEVVLEVSCLGPWCGSVQTGEDMLAFLRKTESGYAIAITPCGGGAFGAPKPAQIKQVKQCFREKGCPGP